MNIQKKILVIAACALLIVSAICFWKGFDLKNNYYQSEKYPSLNRNVYVGGDAYNYIINSNYFTGYMVLGSSSAIGAVILISTRLLLHAKDSGHHATIAKEIPVIKENVNEQELG